MPPPIEELGDAAAVHYESGQRLAPAGTVSITQSAAIGAAMIASVEIVTEPGVIKSGSRGRLIVS